MTTAENLYELYSTNVSKLMDNCEVLCLAAEQDWNVCSTMYEFADGSALLISGRDVQVK